MPAWKVVGAGIGGALGLAEGVVTHYTSAERRQLIAKLKATGEDSFAKKAQIKAELKQFSIFRAPHLKRLAFHTAGGTAIGGAAGWGADIFRARSMGQAEKIQQTVMKQIHSVTPPPNATPAKALISTDYDGTASLVLPELREKLQQNPDMKLAITTGRSLGGIQHAAKHSKDFEKLPLHYLVVQDGTYVFENTHGLPAAEWIKNLTLADNHPEYAKTIQTATNWDAQKVVDLLQGQTKHNIEFKTPTSSSFRFHGDHATDGKAVANDLIASLKKEHGIEAQWNRSGSRYSITPAGVDKSTALEFIAHMEKPQELFTAGNDLNDLAMLLKKEYAGIPNNPIALGKLASHDGIPKVSSNSDVGSVFTSPPTNPASPKPSTGPVKAAAPHTSAQTAGPAKAAVTHHPNAPIEEFGPSVLKKDLGTKPEDIQKLYLRTQQHVAPVFIGATDKLLKSAAQEADPHVIFLARDGIGGYQVAQELLKRFPERYPGMTDKAIHYLHLNNNTIKSNLLSQYIIQETNINKASSVFLSDIGWSGSLDGDFKNLFQGDLGQFKGLHLLFSKNAQTHASGTAPYIHLGSHKLGSGPLKSAGGNPVTHFLKDTYAGLNGRVFNFKQEGGKIVPDMPPAPYHGDVRRKRDYALQALRHKARTISAQDLDQLTPQSAGDTLYELVKDKNNIKDIMVPHEKHGAGGFLGLFPGKN